MIVLALDFPPSRRGVQTYLDGLCRHLDPPPRLVVAPSMEGDRAFDASLPFAVRRLPCPAGPPRLRAAVFVARALAALWEEPGGQPLLCAHWWCAVAGWVRRAVRRRPYAVLAFGIEVTSGRGAWLRDRVLRRAARVLVLSEHTRRRVADAHPRLPPGRLRVAGAGIDPARFSPRDRGESRARLGWGEEPWLLSVGSLAEGRRHKGQDTLLAAAARLLPRHPSLRVAIVGVGSRRGELSSLAARLGMATRVSFLGEVEDDALLDLYAACDVVVHPVRVEPVPGGGIAEEGFGYVVLEAMACGRAVVTSREGSVAEVAGDAAALAETTSAEEVARAIDGILADPARRASLERRARERAVADFSWREAAGRVQAAFDPPARPRVAFLSPVREIGGAERSLLDLLAGREALGIDPVVLLPGEGPLAGAVRGLGVRWISYPLPESLRRLGRAPGLANSLRLARMLLGAPRVLLALHRILAAEEVSILHTNGIKAHLLGTLAAPPGLPVVWHVRDLFGKGSPVASALRGLAAWRAARIVAISRAVAAEWAPGAREGRETDLAGRVRLVPNGIDLARFHPDARGATAWRETLGLSREGPLFTCAGMFASWKGQDVAIEAFAEVRRVLPRAQLVLVGETIYRTGGHGGEREVLERLAARLGVGPAVRFAGYQEDVRPWMWAADAVVHASRRPEPFGRVLIEAMACGRPVVAIRGGGPGEIVADGETGFLVPPGDPRALARGMLRLAGDGALRARMGEEGRRRAERRYGRERMIEAMAAVYREVTAGGAPRS